MTFDEAVRRTPPAGRRPTLGLMLINQHEPEDCPVLYEAVFESPWSAELKGTCPSGEHGGLLAVEADSAAQALSLIDETSRRFVRAVEGDLHTVGDEIPIG